MVTAIAPIRGFRPTSIIATGCGLGRAAEVFYNGTFVEEFIVDSADRLIIRVPESQIGKNITELRAYSDGPKPGEAISVSLELVGPLKVVQGIERLVQSWLIVFYSTPGTSIFHKNSGGGARAIVGRTSTTKGSSVSADLAIAVEATQSEILRSQAVNKRIPPSERLLSSKLSSVIFDPKSTSISGRVSMVSILGENAEFTV